MKYIVFQIHCTIYSRESSRNANDKEKWPDRTFRRNITGSPDDGTLDGKIYVNETIKIYSGTLLKAVSFKNLIA